MPLAGFDGLTYEAGARLLEQSSDMRMRATGLWALGRCANKATPTHQLSDGRVLNERQLYIEALRCDYDYAPVYFNLGNLLSGSETVTGGR